MKLFTVALIALLLAGCGKLGIGGHIDHMIGNWAQVNLPDGCTPHQISAEEGSGVAVLCEDGRVFH